MTVVQLSKATKNVYVCGTWGFQNVLISVKDTSKMLTFRAGVLSFQSIQVWIGGISPLVQNN